MLDDLAEAIQHAVVGLGARALAGLQLAEGGSSVVQTREPPEGRGRRAARRCLSHSRLDHVQGVPGDGPGSAVGATTRPSARDLHDQDLAREGEARGVSGRRAKGGRRGGGSTAVKIPRRRRRWRLGDGVRVGAGAGGEAQGHDTCGELVDEGERLFLRHGDGCGTRTGWRRALRDGDGWEMVGEAERAVVPCRTGGEMGPVSDAGSPGGPFGPG